MINDNLFETMERTLIKDLDRGLRLTRELSDTDTLSREGREIMNTIALMSIATEIRNLRKALQKADTEAQFKRQGS
tara:strand:+ start:313 stop:540 length:228 start_codon:yes stop_codon:yes gene_type:complete